MNASFVFAATTMIINHYIHRSRFTKIQDNHWGMGVSNADQIFRLVTFLFPALGRTESSPANKEHLKGGLDWSTKAKENTNPGKEDPWDSRVCNQRAGSSQQQSQPLSPSEGERPPTPMSPSQGHRGTTFMWESNQGYPPKLWRPPNSLIGTHALPADHRVRKVCKRSLHGISWSWTAGRQMGNRRMQPSICDTGTFARRQIKWGEPNPLCSLFPLLLLCFWPLCVCVGGWGMWPRLWVSSQEAKFPHVSAPGETSPWLQFHRQTPAAVQTLAPGSQQHWLCREKQGAEAWGPPSCPQVMAFVPRVQLSHCSLSVCVPNTQCLLFSRPKENRRWHEASTFSLMN